MKERGKGGKSKTAEGKKTPADQGKKKILSY